MVLHTPIEIKKKELINITKYKQPDFPKYTSSLINLLNRRARGTHSSVVGQMSDLTIECPYKEYDKWREWYLTKRPDAIDKAVKLIISKLTEVKDAMGKINEDVIRRWVIDLVIDKSFRSLKIQEAILIKIEKLTEIKCRLANKEEEQKGIDGFVGDIPVQIKPATYKIASNVKSEKLIEVVIYYKKTENCDYIVDIGKLLITLK